MQDWFKVTKLDDNTFAISEPLHWEETNCYLLLGSKRALLIDSGLGVADIGAAVFGLAELPVLLTTTHVHWDHIGGHRHFSDIAVGENELLWLSGGFPLSLDTVKAALTSNGSVFPPDFHLEDYRIYRGGASTVLRDGDTIELGGRDVTVIGTPGHSPGHLCFFESSRGWLYSGDLIYKGRLDAFYPTTDPAAFRRSVKKIAELKPARILPGHHTLNIPTNMADDISTAFDEIDDRGALHHGGGLFHFEGFEIYI